MSDQSFAELFNETYVAPSRLEPGQKIEAEVVRISREWVFISLGGKSEGCFAISEVTDQDGELTVKEGQKVEAYFLSSGKGGMQFTTKLGKGAAANAHLEEAFRSAIPVEGVIEKEVKGGFEVKVAGSVRTFCPFSQLGIMRLEDEDISGRVLSFKIIEYSENGRNIIVSHRAIRDQERQQKMEELKETLEPGMTVTGTVSSIRNFGAFVDIGGVDGLIPISEICWGHVTDINERLAVGQQVEVSILKLDWEHERFSFSLKDALPNPWEKVADKYQEGSIHQGVVARLTTFGAFVTLEEGVDGLIHISALASRRINHPREVVQEGQEIEVKINSIDLEEKRISLSSTEDLSPRSTHKTSGTGSDEKAIEEQQRQDYEAYSAKKSPARKESMGTFGDLLAAKMKGGE